MWLTSNSPARVRTAMCSSVIPEYSTGMSQPANSTMRAPLATCTACSGVLRSSVGALDDMVVDPDGRRSRRLQDRQRTIRSSGGSRKSEEHSSGRGSGLRAHGALQCGGAELQVRTGRLRTIRSQAPTSGLSCTPEVPVTVRRVLLAFLMSAVVGLIYREVQAQQPAGSECTLAGKGRFSIGWVETQDTERYRCVATFDTSLKPAGTAWIRIDSEGRPRVP